MIYLKHYLALCFLPLLFVLQFVYLTKLHFELAWEDTVELYRHRVELTKQQLREKSIRINRSRFEKLL